MEKNIDIPFEELSVQCGIISPESIKKTAAAVSALSREYSEDELALIYNYFFEKSCNYDVLMLLLDKIAKLRNKTNTALLIDSFLMKDKLAVKISSHENLTRLRIRIAKVLADTKDSQAVYPLLYCLNDKNENYKIKLSCAEALGRIGDRYAVMPLMQIVEDENEASVYVKESAVSALGMIGDEKAVDSLVSILEEKKGFIDKFTFLKERALEALNKLRFKGARVIHALEKSLKDDSAQIRMNAIDVLMNSNDAKAPELIKSMLFDDDSEVVKSAVNALYNLFDREILDDLINDDTIPCLARTAAVSLKEEILYDKGEGNYE